MAMSCGVLKRSRFLTSTRPDQHHHEVAAVALADDLGALGRAVHVHEVRQQLHFLRREILQQRRLRNERVHLGGEARGIAKGLEVRKLLRTCGHGIGAF
jgi:hypothetical protein